MGYRHEKNSFNFRICWLAVSVVVMLVMPWAAVTFVKGDAGMAVCFLLFFVIAPIYSVAIGGLAGKDRKHLWSLPVRSAGTALTDRRAATIKEMEDLKNGY